MTDLKSALQRWTILLGVIQITFGCLVGFLPPSAVSWFRGLVMAHIEFTMNGILLVALGLIADRMSLSPGWLKTWFWSLQLGTWTNGAAGLSAAFLGASSKLLPTATEKFPPPNGMEHPLVTGLLAVCGVLIIVGLFTTVAGLLRNKPVASR
jgi:hypothetical protein